MKEDEDKIAESLTITSISSFPHIILKQKTKSNKLENEVSDCW